MDRTQALQRLSTLDPRRHVDRSQYADESMPEYPGAVVISHVVWSGMEAGSFLGTMVIAPFKWIRTGRKTPLLKTLAPKYGAMGLIGGGFIGAAMLAGMALTPPGPKPSSKPPFTNEGVDDRAFRIVNNQKVQTWAHFTTGGAVAGLVVGRVQAGAGFLGHTAVGMSMATIAHLAVSLGIPEVKKRWPAVKKSLVEAGVDFSWLEVAPQAASPPAKK